jgi:hypothetical protein
MMELQSKLEKFLYTHRAYLGTHTLSYHVFLKNDAQDLWEEIKAAGGLKKLRAQFKMNLSCRHQKWTKKQLKDALWKIHADVHPITKNALINLGRSDLVTISRRFGTFSAIKKEMGFHVVEKRHHTLEEVLNDYYRLYVHLGTIPTRSTLIENGYSTLISRIRRHFGGMEGIRKQLKITSAKKPNGYWNLRNTLKRIRTFYNEHADDIHRSSMSKVLASNEQSLLNAINRYGGLAFLNEKYRLNIPIIGKKWNREKVLFQLKELHEAGHHLSRKNIKEIGHNDLAGVLYKYGNLNEFRQEIGASRRRYNYWNEATVIEELSPIIEKHECIPSYDMLKSMNKHALLKAISKLGGSTYFATLLNVPIRTLHKANDGDWLQSSYECIFDNILSKYNISHRTHTLISPHHRYKCDFLIGKTYIEIAGYYRKDDDTYMRNLNRKIHLYKELKKDHIVIPQKVFLQRINKIEDEVLSILSRIMSLKTKINRVDNEVNIMPRLYWTNLKNIKKELQPLIKEYGRMPKSSELTAHKKHGLIGAINKYHGSLFELHSNGT